MWQSHKMPIQQFIQRIVQTERKCWANGQYSRRDTIEVIDVRFCIRNQDLEDKMRNIFGEIGVNINECDIQASYRLIDLSVGRTAQTFLTHFWPMFPMYKVVNIGHNFVKLKKNLKHLDPSKLSFSEGTKIFINASLYPCYRDFWNKIKKFRRN